MAPAEQLTCLSDRAGGVVRAVEAEQNRSRGDRLVRVRRHRSLGGRARLGEASDLIINAVRRTTGLTWAWGCFTTDHASPRTCRGPYAGLARLNGDGCLVAQDRPGAHPDRLESVGHILC